MIFETAKRGPVCDLCVVKDEDGTVVGTIVLWNGGEPEVMLKDIAIRYLKSSDLDEISAHMKKFEKEFIK